MTVIGVVEGRHEDRISFAGKLAYEHTLSGNMAFVLVEPVQSMMAPPVYTPAGVRELVKLLFRQSRVTGLVIIYTAKKLTHVDHQIRERTDKVFASDDHGTFQEVHHTPLPPHPEEDFQ